MASSLDPILPLPADTGIPPIKEGTGRDLFDNDVYVGAGMTYRAFYILWEQAERLAKQNYPKYVDGPMHHVAEAHLEAVKWCREVAHPNMGELPVLSETEAQKVRAKELKASKKEGKSKKKASPSTDDTPTHDGPDSFDCPKCGPHRTILKKKFKGKKVWKCADCGHRWPREAPTSPSEGRKASRGSLGPGKKKPASQKSKKRAKAKS